MDRNRGILVVAGSFALLAAGVAVTLLARKFVVVAEIEEIQEIEDMIEEYEAYTEATPAPVKKSKPRGVAAKNGHVAPAS